MNTLINTTSDWEEYVNSNSLGWHTQSQRIVYFPKFPMPTTGITNANHKTAMKHAHTNKRVTFSAEMVNYIYTA